MSWMLKNYSPFRKSVIRNHLCNKAVLQSSNDKTWEWSGEDEEVAEGTFQNTFPSIHEHLKSFEGKLRKRSDQGEYWWELRPCAYYESFERPKIIHTDITWRPQFAYVSEPVYLLNTAYLWSTSDLYLLAVINSPLLWSFMWRNATHGKDEALRIVYSFTETLPIAPPTDEIRAEVEPAVQRLIEFTKANQEATRDILDWLQLEHGIDQPGNKLSDFASLPLDDFLQEVKKTPPQSRRQPRPQTPQRTQRSLQRLRPRHPAAPRRGPHPRTPPL